MHLQHVSNFCDELLAPERFADFAPNGLQVPGREEVRRIVTGVSAHRALFERALELRADAILCHHGLFWDGAPLALDRPAARRLKLLLEHDVSLLAYHLPLDAHPEHGNNALLARALGAGGDLAPAFAVRGQSIGFVAELDGGPLEADVFAARVREAVGGREPLVVGEAPHGVRRVGVCSGAAASSFGEALERGCDAFVTGEPAERVTAMAHEHGALFVAAGHHATEIAGIRRLGELVADHVGAAHDFVDVPNPI